jgi:hypothetical protein
MRKRADGGTWFRAEEAPQDLAMPCGDHLGASFELADLVRTHDDEALAAVAFGVAPGVRLEEQMEPGPDGWRVALRHLRQTTGLCRRGDVDPGIAAIVGACDGRTPLAAVLADAARAFDVATDDMKAQAMPIVRRLVEQAFLLPTVAE